MKMLMTIIDQSKREELEVFLNRSGVVGYTEISQAAGMGLTGPRLGSSAFPKTSAVVFTILDDDALNAVVIALAENCYALRTSISNLEPRNRNPVTAPCADRGIPFAATVQNSAVKILGTDDDRCRLRTRGSNIYSRTVPTAPRCHDIDTVLDNYLITRLKNAIMDRI